MRRADMPSEYLKYCCVNQKCHGISQMGSPSKIMQNPKKKSSCLQLLWLESNPRFYFNFSHEYWNTPHLLEGSITCCKMQEESLLSRELIQHLSSPVRGVARCGPTHSGPSSLGDRQLTLVATPPSSSGFSVRKAALGSGNGLCVKVRMTLRLSLRIGAVCWTFLSRSLLNKATRPRWPC